MNKTNTPPPQTKQQQQQNKITINSGESKSFIQGTWEEKQLTMWLSSEYNHKKTNTKDWLSQNYDKTIPGKMRYNKGMCVVRAGVS